MVISVSAEKITLDSTVSTGEIKDSLWILASCGSKKCYSHVEMEFSTPGTLCH